VLCGWGAIALERGDDFLGNERCGRNRACFQKKRDAIKCKGRLAGRVLMTAYQAAGTVAVLRAVIMIVDHRDEDGTQQKDRKERYEPVESHHGFFRVNEHIILTVRIIVNDAFISDIIKCLLPFQISSHRKPRGRAQPAERQTRIGSTTSGMP
jgi:hypothetical protein